MNINTVEWIAAIERQDGKPVNPRLVPFLENMVLASEAFEELGKKHAADNMPPCTDEAFQEWTKGKFSRAPGVSALISEFVKECYMIGYKENVA